MPGTGDDPTPPHPGPKPSPRAGPPGLSTPRAHPHFRTLLPSWPQGLGQPLVTGERPSCAPTPCPEGPAVLSLEPLVPLSVRPSSGPLHRVTVWGPKCGPLSRKAGRLEASLRAGGEGGRGPCCPRLRAGAPRTSSLLYAWCLGPRGPALRRPGGACMADIPGSVPSASGLLFKKSKNPLRNSMFPNLHEVFYHMMCLASEMSIAPQYQPQLHACTKPQRAGERPPFCL